MGEATRHDSWLRLVNVIDALREGPQNASDLAKRFGVAKSTMRRDLLWMERQVRGVVSSRDGRRKMYSFESDPGQLQLHYPAAFCLLTGARAINVLEGSEVWDGFSRVLQFAQHAFGGDVERKICVLRSNFRLSQAQHDLFDVLVQALRHERVLNLVYEAPGQAPSSEEVEPLSLMGWRGRLYLIIQHREEGKPTLKLRRLDRILSATMTVPRRRFCYPTIEQYNPDVLFRHSMGPFIKGGPPDEPVILRFFGEEAERHRVYDWGVAHRIRSHQPFEIELQVHVDYSLRHFVWRAGPEIEVVAPQWFREEVRDGLDCARNRYDDLNK